jgi:2-iminobutanoate/2-iminopropanoate deaminase
MIERTNPDVGYIDNSIFEQASFSQVVKAGNTLYLSGVAPFKWSKQQMEVVGQGDIRKQVEWVLEVIKRCLAKYGTDFRACVAETVYTTNIERMKETMDLFAKYHGKNPPTSTWVEVKGLFHPDQMVEITCTAVLE